MIEDIARGLEADGIIRRRKARQGVEELLSKDKRAPSVSRQDWSRLIRSYIEFEVHEIDQCLKKNTLPPLQNAQLLRSIVRHASSILYCHNSRIPILIKHCIRVCRDLNSNTKYSSIHRDILIDLCENERFTQCLEIETLQIILDYLEQKAKDLVNFFNSNCSKLFIAFCRTLNVEKRMDLASSTCNLMTTICNANSGLDVEMYSISVIFAQCYSIIIQTFSLNYLPALHESFKITLGVICNSIMQSSIRESQNVLLLKFLSQYMDLMTRIHYHEESPLHDDDPLLLQLEFLYVHFTQDAFLRSCVLYVIPMSRDHDYYGVIASDFKILGTIEVLR